MREAQPFRSVVHLPGPFTQASNLGAARITLRLALGEGRRSDRSTRPKGLLCALRYILRSSPGQVLEDGRLA